MAQDFFAEHAISLEVAEARPYRRYDQGDFEFADAVYDDYLRRRYGEAIDNRDTRRERRFLKKIVSQSPGVFIYRDTLGGFRPPPDGLQPSVFPELRPNAPIATRPPQAHYHPTDWPTDDKGKRIWPTHPRSGKNLPKSATHLASNMQRHIEKHHPTANDQGVHEHQRLAKYVFLSGDDHAKRLDVHPLALGLLPTANRVYFVLEGCIKADAVLTAILEHDQRESVISVPSVTLWNRSDFVRVARGFFSDRSADGHRPEVIIICDADWQTNPAVFAQALMCRSMVRRLGYETHVAAPPQASGLKGVDDFLAAGGSLGDLEVLHREAPILDNLFDLRAKLAHHRADKRVNMLRMLTALAEHAYDDDGHFSGSIEKLAKVVGISKSVAYRAIASLVDERIVATDKPLVLMKERFIRGTGYVSQLDWEDRPIFTLSEHLRADPFRFHRLENLHDRGGQVVDAMLQRLCDQVASLRDQNAALTARQDQLAALVQEHFPTQAQYPEIVERFIANALA